MRSVKTVPCRTQEWDFCYNHNISTIISKVLGANFTAAAIRTLFQEYQGTLLNRKIGKENGVVRWSFFCERNGRVPRNCKVTF